MRRRLEALDTRIQQLRDQGSEVGHEALDELAERKREAGDALSRP